MKKRLLSLLLVLAMLLSASTFTVSADTSTEQEIQKATYEINSATPLSLGENSLTLSTTAITTIYKFSPKEAGVYQFVSSDANALVGYWGAGSFYVWDQTENKSFSLEYSLPQVGPSIMIGVSGVESCVLTISKLGEVSSEPSYEKIDYVNQVTPEPFTLPEEVDNLVYIDVTDDVADSAVLGEDGYYHLNDVDGPILFVNLTSGPYNAPLASAAGYGSVKASVYDENGKLTQLINYLPAWEEYVACQDASKKVYPLTIDLMTMFQHIGNDKGWYDIDNDMGFYLFSTPVDKETAWLFSCCYDEDYTGKSDDTPENPGDDSENPGDDPIVSLDETSFNKYKEEQLIAIKSKHTSGESSHVKASIDAAAKAVEELPYDSTKSLDENKAIIDAIITKLEADITTQTPDPVEPVVVSKPKATTIKKAIGGKKRITVKFKKVSGIDGYEIQVALKKNMKKGKKTYIVKANKKQYVAKKLKAGKKYFVRIRTYKFTDTGKLRSKWSKKVTVKTKR